MKTTGDRAGSLSRDENIDTIRALACVGVVSLHVVGNDPRMDMALPQDHYLHGLMGALLYLRMPVFATMAGVFWRSAPQRWGELGTEAKKRAQHILLPFLVVSVLFFVARSLKHGTPITVDELFFTVFHNVTYLWFIQSLLTLMFGGMLLTYLFRRQRRRLIWVLFILSVVIFSLAELPGYRPYFMSWGRTFYLAPYFFLGDLLREHLRKTGPTLQRALGGVLIAVAVTAGLWRWQHHGVIIPNFWATAFGLSGALGLLMLRPRIPLLHKVGPRSFRVYLYHLAFTNLALFLFGALLPSAPVLLLFLGSVGFGVTGPILLERALDPLPPLQLLMFGKARAPTPIAVPTPAPAAAVQATPRAWSEVLPEPSRSGFEAA